MDVDDTKPDGGQQPPAPANGTAEPTPRQSLREIAEASWNEVESAEGDGQEQAPVDDAGQPRDAAGRFAPRSPEAKPGEAEPPAGSQPRQEQQAPDGAKPVDPALGSNQPPQHWSEQDRNTFAKLDPQAQEFLLRRHTEMERDYQGKVQANATAVQFTNALAPVFNDPVISGSLQQNGISPFDAIAQWAAFHRRFVTDPAGLLQELGQRAGLFPAANGQMSQPGQGPALSEDDLKDPAIRFFADHLGQTFNDVQALRGELRQMREQDAQRQSAEVQRVTRWSIDSFADEKDGQGQLLHPHFDAVLPQIIELFRANPERDIREAYETAIWMVPSVRQSLQQAQQSRQQQDDAAKRARQAVRSNVRGITSPVAKPAAGAEGGPKTLRETIEATADEIGI